MENCQGLVLEEEMKMGKKSRDERELFMVLPPSTNYRDSLGGELLDEVIV
jgi:hypothetical protein